MKVLKWKKTVPPNFISIPEKGGVYIISTMQADHEYEAKYVGQTNNLRARAEEHWSKKEKNAKLREHIAEKYLMKFNYSEIDAGPQRDGVELYLFKILEPPFNQKAPAGKDPLSCTVPDIRKYS